MSKSRFLLPVLLATAVSLGFHPASLSRLLDQESSPQRISPRARAFLEQPSLEKMIMSGSRNPAMDAFDREYCELLQKFKMPGGAVAIVRKGKLLYSRAYGYADVDGKKPIQPDSLFRICSISKTITSVAVLKLVQEGKLSLDTRVFPILNLPREQDPSRQPDPRIFKITVRQLLQGTAGWDRRTAGDPMFVPLVLDAASEYSNSLRPTAKAVIRYEFCRPLDFTPGTQFCYSNFEYAILGELIAKITGQKYADYVREKLLKPIGIVMYPGRTREPAPGEVAYYAYKGEMIGPSVFPNVKGPLPLEYGGDFCLEAMTADCGWVASVIDMAKFASAVFGDSGPELQPIKPELVKEMVARPQLDHWKDRDAYFAMGWEIEHADSKSDFIAKKEGCLPGAEALLAHFEDGTSIALAMNNRPWGYAEFQTRLFELTEKTWKEHKYLTNQK